MKQIMTGKVYSLSELEDIACNQLAKAGCDEANARAVAKTMVAAEADGCPSHGLFRMPGYMASLKSGKVRGNAAPRVTQQTGAVLRMDGDGGFLPLARDTAAPLIADLAKENGVAALAICNTYHFSALWMDLEEICKTGLAGMAFTNFLPFVAPAGGSKPLFGTNPMAFGWPRKSGQPMIFDQASSTMARGEVMIAARDGEKVPSGVGVDSSGNPTTDPNEILNGAMLTFGGYKGSSIALMVDLLAGALVGENSSFEAGRNDNGDGGPPKGGLFVVAFDAARISGSDTWDERGERLFSEIGSQGARLPADRRYENRAKAMRDGVTIPESVMRSFSE